jgi:hypothetical protein
MTKRLTLVGFAAVAVLWGPYVYAELARRPAKPPTEAEPIATQPVIETTPVAYKPSARPAQVDVPAHTTVGTSIDPDRVAAPAQPVEQLAEPAAPEQEPSEPFELAPPPAGLPPVEAQPAQAAAAAAPANEPAAAPAAPEAPAPAQEPGSAAAENSAAPAPEPSQQAAEKQAASDLSAHAKAVKDGSVHVIPDVIAPAFRSAFDKETRDVAWAAKEETRIASTLSNAGVPSNAIAEVRCQSTVCRVSINQADIEATAQTGLFERVHQHFGAGLALDPQAQDHRAAFYVMRSAE